MVFVADEWPAQTEHFFSRQHACYQRFRSEAAARPHRVRTSRAGVHLVGAYDSLTGALYGGVGVFERRPDAPLPVELALGPDARLHSALERWENDHIFELSGLWVEEQWRRTGLSSKLMLMAMAAASYFGATKTVGFSHQHVLDFYGTIGLMPDLSVGTYNYPDEKYISTFIWADPPEFVRAPPEARKQIFKLTRSLHSGTPIIWRATPRQPAD